MSTPEFHLIRLAARATLDSARATSFLKACKRPLDWSQVLGLAVYHRLVPLLHAHLRDHGEAPAHVLDALHDEVHQSSVRVLFLSSEMARIARQFESDRLPYLVLKGPSLAEAYGSVAKRPFVDNDLLVRRQDFDRAARALVGLGFRGRAQSDRQQAGTLLVHGEDTFERMAGGARSAADVHTRLVPFGFSYDPPFEDLSRRARTITAAGENIPVLSWGDLFLTLSVNALKDQWDRLRLATDLAEVAPFVRNWDDVSERAGRLGSLRALHMAVLIASDELGGEFPTSILLRLGRTAQRRCSPPAHARSYRPAPTRASGRGGSELL